MGNNVVASVIKVFDRSHNEIQSISAKIDRARGNRYQEKHEVYVENIGAFPTMVDGAENNKAMKRIQVEKFATNHHSCVPQIRFKFAGV